MNLWIDGRQVEAVPGNACWMRCAGWGWIIRSCPGALWRRGIAGETFTLNYVPQRKSRRIRRPCAALWRPPVENHSAALCRLQGRQVYTRTVQFVLFLAIRQLYPGPLPR